MFWRRRRLGDFSSEIQSHIAMETERLQEQGMILAEARSAALREFGNPAASAERFFEASPAALFETLFRDLRYAARVLRKNPAFTAVAVLSLALGIGANTAIFQLVDAVRLRTLPVRNPQELVQIRLTSMDRVRGSRQRSDSVTYPIWEELQARQKAFRQIIAWSLTNYDLATAGEPRFVDGMPVSGAFFHVLGVQPLRGRLFQESDDRPGCGFPGAVISYAFWQREFGGQPGAIGSKLSLNRHPVEIIGITPPSFFGMEVGRSFDVAVPLCSQAAIQGVDLNSMGTDVVAYGDGPPGAGLDRGSRRRLLSIDLAGLI